MPNHRISESGEGEQDKGFLALFEALPYPSLLIEQENGKILNANDAALHFYGKSRSDLLRERYQDLLREPPDKKEEMFKAEEQFSLQCHRGKDGAEIPVEVATASMRFQGIQVVLCLVRDVARQSKLEKGFRDQMAHLRYLAYHDALTGLPNRLLFQDRLEHALAIARRMKYQLALLFIDVDHFKEINDTFGHEAGDKVLCEVSRRLGAGLREADTLARMGGDEFLVILEQIQGRDQVSEVVRKINHSLAAEIEVDGQLAGISVSIGGSLFPVHATDARCLVQAADRALLAAKKKGRGVFRLGPS